MVVRTNERPGIRAQARHVRGSASKARRVLDLIRGESVEEARSILRFSEVAVAETVSKVLESAVANASHNEGIADDELFITACYADEGVTLKRFRPRARGRASRINKRTSHITIIVARYDIDELEERRERQARRGGTSAAQAEARRRRVQRSRGEADVDETEIEEADDSGALDDSGDEENVMTDDASAAEATGGAPEAADEEE